MRILAIETSCDETAIAILEFSGRGPQSQVCVRANIVASQIALHAKFGGVVPHLAKREHQKNLVPVLLRALSESGGQNQELGMRLPRRIQNSKFVILNSILEREPELFKQFLQHVVPLPEKNIDAIAVTIGPGLAPALWVGVNFARALGFLWGKPIIPVNHLEGHILTNVLPQTSEFKKQGPNVKSRIKKSRAAVPGLSEFKVSGFKFPAIALLVSGGHTELVHISGYGKYRILGETLDDAAGEAFDKVAKMLGLGYPGGPIISKLAEHGNAQAFPFPRPMIAAKNFDFSFSGLKTAVLYTLRDLEKISAKDSADIAASFEQAVVDVLVAKTMRAAKQYRIKTVMIGGGVAANTKLRSVLGTVMRRELPHVAYLLPSVALTGDNALMIAVAAYFGKKKKSTWKALQADANLRLR